MSDPKIIDAMFASMGIAVIDVTPKDGIDGEILRPRAVDDEAAQILDELNTLQTWLTLKMRTDGQIAMSAVDLIQRTRILIIERCKR